MKKTVVYSCPFVPGEWIYAHGLRPSRILPRWDGESGSSDVFFELCPYARQFYRHVCNSSADGIVVTTMCDQMRRVAELISRQSSVPVFVLNVPSTWQTPTVRALYLAELERLSRFLVRLGGHGPTMEELATAMKKFDDARRAVRAARPTLSASAFSRLIAEFNRLGEPAGFHIPKGEGRPSGGVPLALIGGPLPHHEIFDQVEAAGGTIVLDATESGERALPAVFFPGPGGMAASSRPCPDAGDKDMAAKTLPCHPEANALRSVLAEAYFGGIPDIFRRPNDGFFPWAKRMLAERQVRGVIYRYYLWCDKWRAEASRFKEAVGLPMLELDIAEETHSEQARMRTRIEAFLEGLR